MLLEKLNNFAERRDGLFSLKASTVDISVCLSALEPGESNSLWELFKDFEIHLKLLGRKDRGQSSSDKLSTGLCP